MAASTLVFRSSLGPWSVWTCACGCSDAVRVWDERWAEMPGAPRVYARFHAPLGHDPVRIGETFSGEYEETADFTCSSFEDEQTPVMLSDVSAPTIVREVTSDDNEEHYCLPDMFGDLDYDTGI